MNQYRILDIISVIDTKTIPRHTPVGGRWVSFDILKAVKSWSTESTKNYGIIIEIEHQSASLPADSVFKQMNCSDCKYHIYVRLKQPFSLIKPFKIHKYSILKFLYFL